MRLANKVKVGGVWYKILDVPDLKVENECSGTVIFGKATIKRDGSMCDQMKSATDLHEIIEIINAENQLGMTHQNIQCLATSLYQVIEDNPEMFLPGGKEES